MQDIKIFRTSKPEEEIRSLLQNFAAAKFLQTLNQLPRNARDLALKALFPRSQELLQVINEIDVYQLIFRAKENLLSVKKYFDRELFSIESDLRFFERINLARTIEFLKTLIDAYLEIFQFLDNDPEKEIVLFDDKECVALSIAASNDIVSIYSQEAFVSLGMSSVPTKRPKRLKEEITEALDKLLAAYRQSSAKIFINKESSSHLSRIEIQAFETQTSIKAHIDVKYMNNRYTSKELIVSLQVSETNSLRPKRYKIMLVIGGR
jgi:hypothetical protein